MSPKRFSQHFANLFPVPARAVLVVLGLFVALVAFASLLLLLSPGPAPVTAAPPEEPHVAASSAAPAAANPALTLAPDIFYRQGVLPLSSGENRLMSAVIDPSAGFAYFGTCTSPGRVVKVRLSDFTRVGALTLNSGENDLMSAVIDPSAGFAYFGTDTSPGRVVKVDLSTFTRVGALTLPSGEDYLRSAVIGPSAGFAYFGTYTSSPAGQVVKVRLSDFTRVGVLPLPSGEDYLRSAVIDPSAGFAYFGTDTSPGRVVKVDLSTFTRVGALTLPSGEDYLRSAVIDPSAGFAYFGTYTSPGQVVKVDLSTFTRVSALPLSSGENYLTSAVIDQSAGFAYFGTDTSSGQVVKVRLSDLTRAGALTLNSGENYLDSAVIDPSAGFAYFGTDTGPGQVVKVRVSKGDTTTTLTSSPNSSVFGQAVTFTATVTSTSGFMPTGIVFFNDSGVTIGTAALNASGVATMTTFSLVAGEHPMTAVYHGDENHEASESAPLIQTVNKANTRTTLSRSAADPVFGQCVTFTATVAISETVPTPGAGTPTGIVTFQDVFTDTTGTPFTTVIGSGTLNGDGVAGFTTCSLAVGQHTIIATYEGDVNFNQSQTSMTFTMDKADTTTEITDSSKEPTVHGESVTFYAVVTVDLPGSGTPTGTVTFKVDGTAEFTGPLGLLGPGEVNFTTTEPLDAGDHDITAEYNGDDNFNGSTSAAFTQTVNKAETTTQIRSSLNPSVLGQEVTFTAIVGVEAPGTGEPTGDVRFFEDLNSNGDYDAGTDIDFGTETLDLGQATFDTDDLPVGDHEIGAKYLGDSNFEDSTDTLTQEVEKADTITFLETSINPSVVGQSITFTATVEATGMGLFAPITPTGTVTFTFGTVGTMTDTLNITSGVASVMTDTLPAGEHEVTAEYGGDINFNGSTSAILNQTVNKADTSTALTSSASPANSSAIGESVTFTATVTADAPGTGTPTGTVTFLDGGREIATQPLVAGVATFTTSDLAAGRHAIAAVYNGDDGFNTSSSAILFHTVGAVGSTTTLTSWPASPTVFGETVTFTATVTAASGTPTGQVTFKDGAATLGTRTLSPTGSPNESEASLSTSTLAVGTHPIKAIYAGDANFAGSTSNQIDHQVDKADTTTTIDSVNPISPTVVGQPVLVNFTVEAVAPGSGTPTGDVTVDDGTGASCTGSVGSSGSCTLIPTTANLKTLTATYAGDDNFNGNPPGAGTKLHQVDPADTTTIVTSSPNPSLLGQEVTITATVTSEPDSTATPTSGDVEFDFDDGSPTTSVPLVNGSASVTHTFTVSGTFTIAADYTNTDGNFEDSSGSSTHYVNVTPADLSVTKTDSPDPVNAGDDVTYVIEVTNNEADSEKVTLVDTLPPEVTFDSATGGCTHDGSALGGVVTCDLGSLGGGASTSVTIIVNVPATTPAGTVLENTAQVNGAQSDTEETTVYRAPRRGDCNGDYAVDLADIWSIVRDIFDPTYVGTTGCDANQDQQVDAGDVPSTVLIMVGGLNASDMDGGLNNPAEGPALAMPDEVSAAPDSLATVPVSFAANGHSITSLAFSVDYDETWLALDPADRDGNDIPDAVVFSLPGDFTASVTFNEDDSDGEIDVFIGDISPPLTSLSDGTVAFLILDVGSSPGETQGAVLFSLDPSASFGDTAGWSIPGTATPTAGQHQIYLPMVFR